MTLSPAGPDDSAGRQPNPIDISVGLTMRKRRRMIGMSQEDLAAALGLTFQQIQKYERGANRVSASKLYEAARALGTPIATFFDGLPDPCDSAAAIAGDAQPDPFLAMAGLPHGPAVARDFVAIANPLDRALVATVARRLADGAGDLPQALNLGVSTEELTESLGERILDWDGQRAAFNGRAA